MSFCFEIKKAKNILLYMLHSLGGTADIYRLFLLLYLADLKYLERYGSLISGDTYIAMKFGPAPFHILCVFKQVKEESGELYEIVKSKIGLVDNQVMAITRHELSHLAEAEVACLFETIQQYKGVPAEILTAEAAGTAWQNAAIDGEISLDDMAVESNATPEMRKYIEIAFVNEKHAFNDINFNHST